MNYYERLGVAETASSEEIRQRRKVLAGQLHPDRDHGDAQRMVEVNQICAVLLDPTARKLYDAHSGLWKSVCVVCGGLGKLSRKRGFKTVEVPCDSCGGAVK
jgi:DnaJ-class molecular chaperone